MNWKYSPTTDCACAWAKRRRKRSRRSFGRAAAAGKFTKTSKNSATATRTRSAGNFPKLPRRVSGYNLDELLPERNFNVARACGRDGKHLRNHSRSDDCGSCIIPHIRSLLLLGYPDVYHAGDHVMDILPFMRQQRLEGVDDLLFEWEKQRGGHEEGCRCCLKGKGWLYVEVRRRHEGRGR